MRAAIALALILAALPGARAQSVLGRSAPGQPSAPYPQLQPGQFLPAVPPQPAPPPAPVQPAGNVNGAGPAPGAITATPLAPLPGTQEPQLVPSAPPPATQAPAAPPAPPQAPAQAAAPAPDAAPSPTASPSPAPSAAPAVAPAPATQQTWLPMGSAQIRVLDKASARIGTLTLKKGETGTYGSLSITLRSCLIHPPDQAADSAAWLDIVDSHGGQDFHGWMFTGEPSIGVLQNPSYDVRPLACGK